MASTDTEMLLDTSFNSKQYQSMLTSPSTAIDSGQEIDNRSIVICGIGISQFKLVNLIVAWAAIANVAHYVIMPLYLTDLVQAGSDPVVFTVMFNLSSVFAFTLMMVIQWCHTHERPVLHPYTRYVSAAVYGLFSTLHEILVVYGSLPTRTRPQLLGILAAATLPNTIICRFIILRKGVSVKRLLCAAIVLFGVFVSLLPNIFSLGSEDGTGFHDINSSQHIPTGPQTKNGTNHTFNQIGNTVVHSWIWPLLVVGGTVPSAVSLVILEHEIKSPNVSLITFVFWGEVFKWLSLVALSWTTLIPDFGITNDAGKFLASVGRGLYCSFNSDPSCSGCLASGVSCLFISACTVTFTVLLTKYAEGAVYTTIIKASSKPLSTLFWTLFVDTALGGLQWRPQFNISTMLAFVGLLLIIPATCLYSYLSNREELHSGTKSNEAKKT